MTLKPIACLALWASAALVLPSSAVAQDRYTPPKAADASLYQALGEKDGIRRVVDGLVQRSTQNPRIADKFKDTNLKNLREQLTDQICELSGGPCRYEGNPMRAGHEDLKLNMGHFNALVEDLQQAMDQEGIPFRQQNRLLAILAPMYRDVVTAPGR
ncbi:group 1 truncated hemoglobin [Curvibacter sp. HBC61]|uniref:Group 1 truncated hemoglobin n=1 Tax=Curvibacter cyanobacteriorum TaxID=3026422 RepID=A0ABT5N020_9BURK|nr:group 1 truncated hemoglobin [Curvibacter sp. HBC61]MDD0839670.1 group 1 truncated hemoglobin [Curvibacter sp. HBC61]